MGIALRYARRGLGDTFPNPSVGAIIVKEGQIIAAGNTAHGGRPHAEVLALKQAGSGAQGATMYVTLEPCCHTGVTPPCTKALIESGLSRVVIATKDPDPRVSGDGIRLLESANISISYGIKEATATALNAGFFSRIIQNRPYITLKLATTLDGKIACKTGESNWITGASSRNYAHLLRAEHDAIMVGINTALTDNPTLTCRLPGLEKRSPIRVIIDSKLRLPIESVLIKTIPTARLWVVTCSDDNGQKEALRAAGVTIIEAAKGADNRVDITQAMAALAQAGITRLLIEGGGVLAASCIKSALVDSLIWIRAPMLLGNDAIPAVGDMDITTLTSSPRWVRTENRRLGEDMIEIYSQKAKDVL